ncbi:Zn-dependent oligopeptidase [Microbacterium sp. M28]|uniref:M3 family metallopeptidase n=1 Tax=Microbacterium sp. M28 TaxID=2962064 RepID=UPI0021F46D15|nr:M3 family metallopeptidase [Microbacterium sp. M28]UYO97041.1 Zn-dependent oligopeptidase [Microbacterium sp. M28]
MALEPLALPAADWNAFIAERSESSLSAARDVVARLKDGTSRTALETLQLWNLGEIATANASSFTQLLAEVHPDAAARELAEQALQEASAFVTERDQDRELYEVFAALDADDLDAQAARLLERILRDFRRGGVDQDDATRTRLAEISARITVVDQEFSRNVRDDVRSIRIAPERLAGLPEDFVAAHPEDEDGLVEITTDYPDFRPFRAYAHDAAAREEIARAYNDRGWPVNGALLHELLDLRAEQAQLLGYDSWPDFDTEVKMIGTGAAIGDFIERIAELSGGRAAADLDALLTRARRDDPTITEITTADAEYYGEILRREQYDVDAQEVRRYFDFSRVRQGLLDVTGRLFGLTYREVPDAPVWADEVASYDVLRDGERIGRIHLDLHPRDGKYKHAAQFDLVTGVRGIQLPEGVLVCNFPRGLMEHEQVKTLFHEFGHLLHHVLGGDQVWARFSGVATEWDFVEAPSQMLEEWAWDADILRTFALDADGAPIPADLVSRMREAADSDRGRSVRTQIFYAAVSYRLHLERPADHDAAMRELSQRYSVISLLPDTHFQAGFGHLTSYSSGYYTYMWSLVIAKDLFSAFDPADLFAPEVAGRYRDEVLARGGSADAADLVASFLGRPYSFDAFGAWLAG